MVNTQQKIMRVFGPTGAEVSYVLRGIRDDGCPGLRLLERDGEFAICVQVSAPNRAMAEQYCDKWAARLRAKFGDDVFAEGETSLAQATLDALLEKRKLLVAVDEPTGRLLGSLLQPLPHSEAVFDFGTESYADPQKSRRITIPEQLLKRFPGRIWNPPLRTSSATFPNKERFHHGQHSTENPACFRAHGRGGILRAAGHPG